MSRTVIVTPRGYAKYPHLNTPDTKFKAEGEYHVKLVVRTVLAEATIKQIDDAHIAAIAMAKKENPKLKSVKEANLPYKLSEENDEETVFNIKMRASFKDKKQEVVTMRPALFDAKGAVLAKGVKIGGGSILRVSFEPVPFYTATVGAGVTLRLKAVQVIDLKSYGDNADAYGFEVEEGFETPKEPAEGVAPTDEKQATPSGEDF